MREAELAMANARIKELHHQLPEARVVHFEHGDPWKQWCVYSRLTFSVDGTTENGVTAVCVIAEAPTAVEALARAHRVANDPHRMTHYLDRHIKGLPLDDAPPPLTAEEQREEDAMRARVKLQRERAVEGMRKQMRNVLRSQGLFDVAKKFHKKTGSMPGLFGSMREFFDFGR